MTDAAMQAQDPTMAGQRPILMGRGLTKRYGRVVALDTCDFDLYPGEILAVIGDMARVW
jgi:fructose transport system ATP-binding protein